MDDHQMMFLRKGYKIFEKTQVNHFSGRVVGKADDQHPGMGPGLFGGGQQLFEAIAFPRQGNRAQISSCNHNRIGMDGISRVGDKDYISGPNGRQYEMADALLCAYGHDALRLRIELNIKTPVIKIGHGQTKFINAFGGRVSMVPWIFNRFDQFMNNMFGSGEIRIPHAQINDILPSLPGLYLQLIHNAENIRRQPHHPMKSGTLGVKRIHMSFLSMPNFKIQMPNECQISKKETFLTFRL